MFWRERKKKYLALEESNGNFDLKPIVQINHVTRHFETLLYNAIVFLVGYIIARLNRKVAMVISCSRWDVWLMVKNLLK